jgi:hypothetical protein
MAGPLLLVFALHCVLAGPALAVGFSVRVAAKHVLELLGPAVLLTRRASLVLLASWPI